MRVREQEASGVGGIGRGRRRGGQERTRGRPTADEGAVKGGGEVSRTVVSRRETVVSFAEFVFGISHESLPACTCLPHQIPALCNQNSPVTLLCEQVCEIRRKECCCGRYRISSIYVSVCCTLIIHHLLFITSLFTVFFLSWHEKWAKSKQLERERKRQKKLLRFLVSSLVLRRLQL